jgi:hypothetical protein
VPDETFEVQGSGLSGFRVLGFRFRVVEFQGFRVSGFRVVGLQGFRAPGFRVDGFQRLRVSGFRVVGFQGFRVSLTFEVQGSGLSSFRILGVRRTACGPAGSMCLGSCGSGLVVGLRLRVGWV